MQIIASKKKIKIVSKMMIAFETDSFFIISLFSVAHFVVVMD